jgi:hypothetical protein
MKRLLAALALLASLASPAWADSTIVPDPVLTPGQARTANIGEICSTPTSRVRHWARERDDRIMAEYGLPGGRHPDFEIDHLIPLCLGGTDDDANLWPEPRRSIESTWNAERKDEFQARMSSLACSGELDVATAQKEIADNWTDAWRKYFRESGNFFPPAAGAAVPKPDNQRESGVKTIQPRRKSHEAGNRRPLEPLRRSILVAKGG